VDVHALVLEVDPIDEDTVLGLFARASLGAEVAEGAGGRSTVRVFVERAPDRAAVERALARAGIDPGRARIEVARVPDEPWVERYQRGLAPFACGRGFWVDPTGSEDGDPPAGRVRLRLEPGRAFGTGEHASTRLCVAALEDLVQPGERWLDLGCGTGILALVACHRGAVVAAVDHDPEAVRVAREVVRANGLSTRIDVRHAPASDDADGSWHGIVANLDERTLVDLARSIARRVAPPGVFVGAGFLDSDVPAIESALTAAGLVPQEVRRDAGWAAVIAVRST
jgi:ribosomal protein L11 methyltransferase